MIGQHYCVKRSTGLGGCSYSKYRVTSPWERDNDPQKSARRPRTYKAFCMNALRVLCYTDMVHVGLFFNTAGGWFSRWGEWPRPTCPHDYQLAGLPLQPRFDQMPACGEDKGKRRWETKRRGEVMLTLLWHELGVIWRSPVFNGEIFSADNTCIWWGNAANPRFPPRNHPA